MFRFLIMVSPVNDVHSHTEEITNPPPYSDNTAPPVWTVPLAPSSDQNWSDQSLPPAYHTLSDHSLPWPASQLSRPPTPGLTSIQPSPVYNPQWNIEASAPAYDSTSIPPSSAHETHSQNVTNTSSQGTTLSIMEQRFLKGRPTVHGVLMIMAAIGQIGVGISLLSYNTISYSRILQSGFPYWTSTFYFITGALLMAAEAKSTPGWVMCSIFCNFITFTFCCAGIAISVLDLHECLLHNFCEIYPNAPSLYHGLIAINVLILLFSLPAASAGIYAFAAKSKEDPQPLTRPIPAVSTSTAWDAPRQALVANGKS